MSLGTTAAKGAAVTLSLQTARFVVQLSGLVVLARLLAPSDFGLIAMVTALIGIGDILREFGLVPAAIQAKVLSHDQKTNLFWLCSCLGLLVALLACAVAPLISTLYNDYRLIEITFLLSLTFLFNGLQSQFQAGLAREMRFAALSISDLFAQMIGLGLGIIAALLGFGYWSLVVQLLSQSFSLLILRICVAKWTPGWPNKLGKIGDQLRFGKSLVLTQSLVYVSSNVDSLLVGSRFGATELGFYNRGFQILMMPLNQILTPLTTVALPVLSRVSDDAARFNNYLQRAQIVVAYPTVLLFSGMAASAYPLIKVVFGENWTPSAPVFQALALGGVFQAIGYVGYWVFLSKALTASHFRFSLLSRSILVSAILVGSFWGPVGVAVGYSTGIVLNWPLGLLWLRRVAGIRVRPLFAGGLRAVLLGATSAVASIGVHIAMVPGDNVSSILVTVGSGLLFVCLIVTVVPIYRRDMVAILATARLVVGPKITSLQKAEEKAN